MDEQLVVVRLLWLLLAADLAASWRCLRAILGSKIEEESIKMDIENETFLESIFLRFSKDLGSQKWLPNPSKIQQKSK